MSAFLQLMKSANPAMVVVTASADGARAGCLVGFHGQSGVAPQHYAVWLSKANHTYRVALRSTHLAVHFLTAADADIAEHFGTTTGEETDKFAGYATEDGAGGVPLLDALGHRMVGTHTALLDVRGDHACVCLAIEEAVSDGAFTPLRFRDVEHLQPGHEVDERAVTPEG